jgi:two-component system sensor histidine kinase MprB
MSLRLKFAVAMVALAAGATIAGGAVSYVATSNELRDQVDASLVEAAQRASGRPLGDLAGGREPWADRDRRFSQILVQVIDVDGGVRLSPASGALPVVDADLRVASGTARRASVRHDVTIDDEPYRVLTVGLVDGGAVQFARSLSETERALSRIRYQTLLIVVVTSSLAAVVGIVIAQQVTRRLVRLTEVATEVATSRDLDVTVPVEGRDETGRLGAAFNEMLSSLATSRRAQQQLVQDAGHELRTPLTSLRTNVRVMQRFDELSPSSRERLLADLESETKELTSLVNELVELATERRDDEVPATVALGEVAVAVADRARRRTDREITVHADPSTVVVRPQALERAISNLVENALKFSDGPVEVTVEAGVVRVDDRGPGLDPADVPRLFDRFYRSDAARALPGSGLGLAIVRDMAETHGGTVFAAGRDGGGASVGFRLPLAPVGGDSDRPDPSLPPPPGA